MNNQYLWNSYTFTPNSHKWPISKTHTKMPFIWCIWWKCNGKWYTAHRFYWLSACMDTALHRLALPVSNMVWFFLHLFMIMNARYSDSQAVRKSYGLLPQHLLQYCSNKNIVKTFETYITKLCISKLGREIPDVPWVALAWSECI